MSSASSSPGGTASTPPGSRLASELAVRPLPARRAGSPPCAPRQRGDPAPTEHHAARALKSSARLRAAWCSGRSAVQGRQDLNLRRAGLESAALAGLSYAPSVTGAWHGGGPGRDRFSGTTSASSRARTSARVRNRGARLGPFHCRAEAPAKARVLHGVPLPGLAPCEALVDVDGDL